jgi:peptidoglycan/LPS O-acetylase OafA/YrhL
MLESISHRNNFDLIRLLAALQVLIYHAFEHFHLRGQNAFLDSFISIIHYFPGVPIFFSISGFLIYWSFERNSDNLKQYIINRLLRIYPALWFCLTLTLFALFYFNIIHSGNIFSKQFILWLGCQISFLQFWTPDILRSYGLSNPNGNLWTITVELQFYILVPILFYIIKKINTKSAKNIALIGIALVSYGTNQFLSRNYDSETMVFKLGAVWLLPYLFYFILGILLYKNFNALKKILEGKALYWLAAYSSYSFIFSHTLGCYGISYWQNPIGLVSVVLLIILTISAAFTANDWSKNMLRGNDFSYGIYIYHGVVLNVLVQMQYNNSFLHLFVLTIISAALSFLSWKWIEKPCINLKKRILQP